MCAIFGFVSRGCSRVSALTLARIIRANVARGPHAFGFAWVDADGRLHAYRQAGRFTDHLGILAMARDARMLIGHLRYATHGEPTANINNHPHPADGGWIVHNGVVRNHERLAADAGLLPVSDCDSEALGLFIERSSAPLLRRCADAVEAADGALALLGLWSRPGVLVAARRGNPLHLADDVDGTYLATLPDGLPGRPAPVRDNTVRLFRRRGPGIDVKRQRLRTRGPVAGALYDADGSYRGG